MGYSVVIVGATGTVGREILNLLHERSFPIREISVLASKKSMGADVSFGEKDIKIKSLEDFNFREVDIAFFATSSKISAQHIPKATAAGAIVIDKSSHFRLDPAVPLLVPEINGALASAPKKGILANPNCVAIPLAMALKPLTQVAPLKRVVVSTYQSVSGAGRDAMDELFNQTRAVFVNDGITPEVFSKQIAFNLIPRIDDFKADGSTGEEEKIALETRKILESTVKITATCVRVPVFIGHSLSVNIEFEKAISVSEARDVLQSFPGVVVMDRREEGGYVTPLEVVGEDTVAVSRIRKDETVPYGLSLWICCDNLRKGAALNGVQIAEAYIDSLKALSKFA